MNLNAKTASSDADGDMSGFAYVLGGTMTLSLAVLAYACSKKRSTKTGADSYFEFTN